MNELKIKNNNTIHFEVKFMVQTCLVPHTCMFLPLDEIRCF